MSDHPNKPTPRDDAHRQVLDPAWEDELRAGLEQDGGAGSVDEELAALHFLRHLSAPQELAPADLEGIWQAMEPQLRPKPWWQRAWFVVGAPALAGGAALLLVLATPPETIGGDGDDNSNPRIAAGSAPSPSSSAEASGDASTMHRPAKPQAVPRAVASAASAASASALLLEQHFSTLEPDARRKLAGRVDLGRAHARGEILARARGTRS